MRVVKFRKQLLEKLESARARVKQLESTTATVELYKRTEELLVVKRSDDDPKPIRLTVKKLVSLTRSSIIVKKYSRYWLVIRPTSKNSFTGHTRNRLLASMRSSSQKQRNWLCWSQLWQASTIKRSTRIMVLQYFLDKKGLFTFLQRFRVTKFAHST